MAGGVLQLVTSTGYEDIILSSNPNITYFKTVYRRFTNFSSNYIDLTFDGIANFGTTSTCEIKKDGDLVGNMFVHTNIPAIIAYFPHTQLEDTSILFSSNGIIIITGTTNSIVFSINGTITVTTILPMNSLADYQIVLNAIKTQLYTTIDYNQIYEDLTVTFTMLINAGIDITDLGNVLNYMAQAIGTLPNTFWNFINGQIAISSITRRFLNYDLLLTYYIYHSVLTTVLPDNNILFSYVLDNYKFNTTSKSYFDIAYKNNYILASLLKSYNDLTSSNFTPYIQNTITYTVNAIRGMPFDKVYNMINNNTNVVSIEYLQNLFQELNIIPYQFCEFNHLYQRILSDSTIPAQSMGINLKNNLNYHIYNNYQTLYNLLKQLLFSTPFVFTKSIQLAPTFTNNIINNNNYTNNSAQTTALQGLSTTVHLKNFNFSLFAPAYIYNGSAPALTVDPLDIPFSLTNSINDVSFQTYSAYKEYDSYYSDVVDGLGGVPDINPSYNTGVAYNQWEFNNNPVGKYVSYNLSSTITPIVISPTTNAQTYFSNMTPTIDTDTTIVPPTNSTQPNFNIFNDNVFINYLPLSATENSNNLATQTLNTLSTCETEFKFLYNLTTQNTAWASVYPHHDFTDRTPIPVTVDITYEHNYNNILEQIKNISFSNDFLKIIQSKIALFTKQSSQTMQNIFIDSYYNNLFANTKIWLNNVIPVDIASPISQQKNQFFNFNLNTTILSTFAMIHDNHMRVLDNIIPVGNAVVTILQMIPLIKQQYDNLYQIKLKEYLIQVYTELGEDALSYPLTNQKSTSNFVYTFKPSQCLDLNYIVSIIVKIINDIRFAVLLDMAPLTTSYPFDVLLAFCEIKKVLLDYTYYIQLAIVNHFAPNTPVTITRVSSIVYDITNALYYPPTHPNPYSYDQFITDYVAGGWYDSVLYMIIEPSYNATIYGDLRLTFFYHINNTIISYFNDLMNGILDSRFITDVNSIIYANQIINRDALIASSATIIPAYNPNGPLFDVNNVGLVLFEAGYQTNEQINNVLANIETNPILYDIDNRQFLTETSIINTDINSSLFNSLTPSQQNTYRLQDAAFNIIAIPVTAPSININGIVNGLVPNTTPITPIAHYIDYYRINRQTLYATGNNLTYNNFLSSTFPSTLSTTQYTYLTNIYIPTLVTTIQTPINYGNSFLQVLFDISNEYVLNSNLYQFFSTSFATYQGYRLLNEVITFSPLATIISTWNTNVNPLITGIAQLTVSQCGIDLANSSMPIEYNTALSNLYLAQPNAVPAENILLNITPNTLQLDSSLINLQFYGFRVQQNYLEYVLYKLFFQLFNTDLFTPLMTLQLSTELISSAVLSEFAKLIKQINNAQTLINYIQYQYSNIVERPSIPRTAWIRKLGHYMIEYMTIELGGQIIDTHYSDFVNIWYELTRKGTQEKAHALMIGDIPSLYEFNSNIKPATELYLPTYFWYTKQSGLVLPLVALQYQSVKLIVKWRTLAECLYSDPYSEFLNPSILKLYEQTYGSTTIDSAQLMSLPDMNRYVEQPALGDTTLLTEYFYIENEERQTFCNQKHEYVIEQLQYAGDYRVPTPFSDVSQSSYLDSEFNVVPQSEATYLKVMVPLNFKHPVKCLLFTVKLDILLDETIRVIMGSTDFYPNEKQFYNYSMNSYHTNIRENPVIYASLQFCGQQRIAEFTDEQYYRLLQPYQCQMATPQTGVYLYSFAIDPRRPEPSGSANMSRLDDCFLVLYLKPTITPVNSAHVIVYAINHNVLRIMSGLSGLAFF